MSPLRLTVIFCTTILIMSCKNPSQPLQITDNFLLQVSVQKTQSSTNADLRLEIRNQFLVFTGNSANTSSIAWSSEQLIGSGGQRLEFSVAETVGTTLTAVTYTDAVATLTAADLSERTMTTEFQYPLGKILERNLTNIVIDFININEGSQTRFEVEIRINSD
ncbi:MAG: hypothetical protein MI717_13230 [Spirochaetales bacterium]|nr:hypothetical protein [Spirochaetales bacterium]